MPPPTAHIIPLTTIHDSRGDLGVVDAAQDLGFTVQRAFYIYNTPTATQRGGHAHKTLHQFLISMGGPVALSVHDGQRAHSHTLAPWVQGLHLPPAHWIDIEHFDAGTTLLVLCSAAYDEADYLRDFADFLRYCGPAS